MLIGVILRSIKIYRKQHYIPISDGRRFCSFVGPNGSGKSSVLEALNALFNKRDSREWNISVGVSGGAAMFPFIAAVFLVPKAQLASSLTAEEKSTIEKLSNLLWTFDDRTLGKPAEHFREHRELLKQQYSSDTHYLVIVGRQFGDNNAYYLSSFHKQSQRALGIGGSPQADEAENEKLFQEKIRRPLGDVLASYQYFYIPVETDPFTYTKLETEEMQSLIGESIHEQIEKAIDAKALAAINTSLDQFIGEIEKKLNGYKYQAMGRKEKLTKRDIVRKTIEVYFSAKTLHMKREEGKPIPIGELSSGEKRRSLVDVAHAFLTQPNKPERAVIFAIDEPDASLHISACFDQFEKLKEISNAGHQVLTSTHWYGFMPVISDGIAHSMGVDSSGEPRDVESFDLYSYPENIKHKIRKTRNELPKDVNLKGQNDLVQAIVASVIRDEPYNWIICEGMSDKIYIQAHLHELSTSCKLRILPVAGRESVRRLYEHLALPLKDKDLVPKGRILCLIDTDDQVLTDIPAGKPDVIQFKRLLWNERNKVVDLVNANDARSAPKTDVEDCLKLAPFASALERHSKNFQFPPGLVEKAGATMGTYSRDIDFLRSESAFINDNFFDIDDNKVKFARTYADELAKLSVSVERLPWLVQIEKFFEPDASGVASKRV